MNFSGHSFPIIRGRRFGPTVITAHQHHDDVIQKHACVVEREKMLKVSRHRAVRIDVNF
jgi:hypothetical protein